MASLHLQEQGSLKTPNLFEMKISSGMSYLFLECSLPDGKVTLRCLDVGQVYGEEYWLFTHSPIASKACVLQIAPVCMTENLRTKNSTFLCVS